MLRRTILMTPILRLCPLLVEFIPQSRSRSLCKTRRDWGVNSGQFFEPMGRRQGGPVPTESSHHLDAEW